MYDHPSFNLESIARLREQMLMFRSAAVRIRDGLAEMPSPTPEDLIDPESERAERLGRWYARSISAEHDVRTTEAALGMVDQLEAHFVAGREAEFRELVEKLPDFHESLQLHRHDLSSLKADFAELYTLRDRERLRSIQVCDDLREEAREVQGKVQRGYDRAARVALPADPSDTARAAAYAKAQGLKEGMSADLGLLDATIAIIDRAEEHARAGRIEECGRLIEVVKLLSVRLTQGRKQG